MCLRRDAIIDETDGHIDYRKDAHRLEESLPKIKIFILNKSQENYV